MGLFNGMLLDNALLRDNRCPFCTSKGFKEWKQDAGRASFDYVCPICNPNVVISLSDMVVGSTLLDEISKSGQRFELKEDIKHLQERTYPVLIRTLDFFLGNLYKLEPVGNTYEKWMKGDLPGLPRLYEKISESELEKINNEQQRLFEEKVTNRLSALVEDFAKRETKSLNKETLRKKEIQWVDYLLNTDNLPHKGVGDEIMELGPIKLSLPLISGIRSEYEKAVNGDTDFNQMLSPNQKTLFGFAKLREKSLVDAYAFQRYSKFLDEPFRMTSSSENEYFSETEFKDLRNKIDQLLEDISQMKYELQTGQQVLFDEIDDLKSLPELKKKNWAEILRGKLFGLVVDKIITIELFQKIYKALTGDEIKLLHE